MSVFKIKDHSKKKKPIKQVNKSNLLTIHQAKMKEFRKDREYMKEIEAHCEAIKGEIAELEGIPCKTISQLKELSELKEKCKELTQTINRLTDCSDMMNYYYDTSDLITAYNELELNPTKDKIAMTNFFRNYATEQETVQKKPNQNKRYILEEYLEVTDPDYIRGSHGDDFCYCENCDTEMTLKKDNGIYICTTCGITHTIMVEGDTSKSSVPESAKYSVYQRKNHFKEWLNQIQAKESTDIPKDVFDMILVELNKIHFQNLAELTPTLIRNILKKLNLSKYYENVFHIMYRLNGLQPPTLSREVEDKLLNYFKQIEEPFRIYKKKGRKNILRYSYILYKLCELMELDEFLRCFKLLKNRTKLMEQDTVWASICKHLGWEFIPSM